MKQFVTILTAVSAIACGLLFMLLVASYGLSLCNGDSPDGDWSQNSIRLAPRFRVGFSGGGAWFFSHDYPYHGSWRLFADGDGIAYPGGHARIERDRSWEFRDLNFGQLSYWGEQDEFVGRDQFADFPGIYYRHFEWMDELPLWTLRVSLWYPITLFAIMPLVWLMRHRQELLRKWFADGKPREPAA